MIIPVEQPIIEIHDLTVSYHRKPVLWDIDLSFPSGKLIGIVGPNGAGKSTLFKTMMGIIPSDSGYVKFFDQKLSKVRKRLSYVPQRMAIDWNFPATVYEIVMMGRYAHMNFLKRPSPLDKQIVQEALAQVEMTHLAHRQIGALSGGQQQRVFISRALAQQTDILLLDEPFAGVDTTTERLTLDILQTLVKAGKSVILVHHSLDIVKHYCDYTVFMNMYIHGAGPTKQVFTPEILQATYGGKSTILSNISNILHQKSLPVREKKP